MSILDWLSVIIGACNPTSAMLTGPFLALRVSPERARQFQGAGWLMLAIGQTAFLAYGVLSGAPGFRWLQPVMIVVALLQYGIWRRSGWRQNAKTS